VKAERRALKKHVQTAENALELAERMVGRAKKEIAARLRMAAQRKSEPVSDLD
jgi:hypothetical protein